MTFIDEAAPDLIFLDWMMPLLSGIEVCRRVKSIPQTRDIPVLMLNARTEEVDAVRGLDTGADEYVIKPYNLRELMARVRSQLRRARPATGGDVPRYKDIELNAQTHRVSCGESDVKLGPTKYRLLVTFLEKQGRVLSRDQLLDLVWGARCLCRYAHGGCAYRAPAQGAHRVGEQLHYPHGTRCRLCFRLGFRLPARVDPRAPC